MAITISAVCKPLPHIHTLNIYLVPPSFLLFHLFPLITLFCPFCVPWELFSFPGCPSRRRSLRGRRVLLVMVFVEVGGGAGELRVLRLENVCKATISPHIPPRVSTRNGFMNHILVNSLSSIKEGTVP